MNTNQVTLGYWDIRGLVEFIRLLLEYLEVPYKQEIYTSKEQWEEKKPQLNTLFPNLPYLVDGDKTLTESEAILAYVCIKAGKPELLGKDEDQVEFVQLKGVILDIFRGFNRFIYGSKDTEELKKEIANAGQTNALKLKGIEDILGKKEWVLGYLSYLDFILAEFVDRWTVMDQEIGTEITKNYPNIVAHSKRLLDLAKVKEYRQSERFIARPVNMPYAFWK